LPIRIDYKASVFKDLKKIGMPAAKRILDNLEKELSKHPHKGTPLKGDFQGLFKMRVGDYRVIYTKTKTGILVLRIGHRSKVYR